MLTEELLQFFELEAPSVNMQVKDIYKAELNDIKIKLNQLREFYERFGPASGGAVANALNTYLDEKIKDLDA